MTTPESEVEAVARATLRKMLWDKAGSPDHMTACEKTMGATHPCTCGADAARAFIKEEAPLSSVELADAADARAKAETEAVQAAIIAEIMEGDAAEAAFKTHNTKLDMLNVDGWFDPWPVAQAAIAALDKHREGRGERADA